MSNVISKQQTALAISVPKLSRDQKTPWNPWLACIYGVLLFFIAQFLAGLVLAGGLYIKYGAGEHTDMLLNSAAFQFWFVFAAEAITVGGIIWFVRRYKVSLATIGLVKPRLKDPLWLLPSLPVYYLLFVIITTAAKALYPSLDIEQKQELGFDSVVGLSDQIFTFFSLVIFAPIAEELLFRGFLFTTLRTHIKVVAAAIITSLIFGAAHLAEGGASGPLYIGAIQTFCLSLVLIFIRQKSKSLWPGIWLHAANNFIAFIVLFVLHQQ